MENNTYNVISLESFMPYRLSVLEQKISRAISSKYRKPFKLSRMQWRVLSTLAQFDGITAREICEFTHMEKMQASRAISGLLTDGLLSQAVSRADQRAHVLSLTAKGRDLYQLIVPEVLAEEKRIFSCLSESEQEAFRHLVDKLSYALTT